VPAATNLAADPGTHTVYVTNVNDGDNSVSVIDASTRSVTAAVPLGRNSGGLAIGVAVDPSAHTVYVINDGDNDGTVSVIDPSTRTVTATVPLGTEPGVVAVDPSTHTVYVTTKDNSVSVIESR
jgi:YVTN family beta-propeller protein